MTLIAPSILSADSLSYGAEIDALTQAGADWIHYDVMDGHYVPNMTFGLGLLRAIKARTTLPVDVHLMVSNTTDVLSRFIDAGADHLSIHPETCHHPYRDLLKIREAGCKAGVAINPGTPLETIFPLLEICDIALVMTVNPGFAGQSFIPSQIQKIKDLRHFIDKNNLNCRIEVDGGIHYETGQEVIDAGADVLVVGYGIFGKTGGLSSDTYSQAIQSFKALSGNTR